LGYIHFFEYGVTTFRLYSFLRTRCHR